MSYKLYTNIKAKSISYGATRKASAIKYLVYHYTGNTTDKAESNAKYFRDTNTRQAGAHYFVDATSVYQSIDDLKVAWAVGGSKYGDCTSTGGGKMYGKITNTNSISIEICSTNGKPAEETLKNAAELGRKLMKKYNIPIANVYRHFDVTGKSCPGWNGWIKSNDSEWKKFKKRLKDNNTEKKEVNTKANTKAESKTETKKEVKKDTKKAYDGKLPTMTLSTGSTGIQVKYLQKFLNWCGYKITVDGNYGLKTKEAVKKFQKANELKVDGIFGGKSLDKAKSIKK